MDLIEIRPGLWNVYQGRQEQEYSVFKKFLNSHFHQMQEIY
jgi:hypothetical protein